MEVWIARFIGPATRERNDNHSKNQMQWCGIARAPRRSPDAGLTDDGLLMEVRVAKPPLWEGGDGNARADAASIMRCVSSRFPALPKRRPCHRTPKCCARNRRSRPHREREAVDVAAARDLQHDR